VWGKQAVLSRLQRALVLLCCFTQVGCGGVGGDFLWWPSFHYYPTAYTNTIPVHDVALEVQCEIYRFLDSEKGKSDDDKLLDPTKGAGVALMLQTDLTGSVQYVGVDLSKLGFSSLAELVTATNKVPSLQAKATGTSTVSAEVDFTVAQFEPTPNELAPSTAPPSTAKGKNPPAMLVRKPDISEAFNPNSTITYENAKFNPVDPDHPTGEFWANQVKPAKPTAKPLPPFPKANCQQKSAGGDRPFYQPYLELWLDDWLTRYEQYREKSIDTVPFVCSTKVTLKSMFKVVVDASAGVNAFMAPPIILPISGFNVDASPDYIHSIAISLALQEPKSTRVGKGHQAYCNALGPGTQPAVK
jgi:hypothetical protein